jgi:hypothetical protein
VIGLHNRRGGIGLQLRLVEQQNHIVKQRASIELQRQRVVPLLSDDLLGDGALAVERIGGHDRAFEGAAKSDQQ